MSQIESNKMFLFN